MALPFLTYSLFIMKTLYIFSISLYFSFFQFQKWIYTSSIHTYSFIFIFNIKKHKKKKKGLLCSHVSSFFLWYFLISCFYVALQAWRGREIVQTFFFSWWLHIMILNEVYELILIWIEECKNNNKKKDWIFGTNRIVFVFQWKCCIKGCFCYILYMKSPNDKCLWNRAIY